MILKVELGVRSYPIIIGQKLLFNSNQLLPYIVDKHVAIITNETIAAFYLESTCTLLKSINKKVTIIILPDGEKEKNWTSLMKIFNALLINKCDRKTTLIALGGGVIGDLTGFAAASYMRGVPFIQIPTTLLAQVDSSLGGKTGINHSLGKNMIGAFYQPKAVIADITTLQTLSEREFSAGLAEVIKYGAIIDISFFNWIESNIATLMARDHATLIYTIHHSCKIKADIICQDEYETGLRAILNFGHTFGHAIESGLGYGTWLHGEAVGCGMVMAANLSYFLGYIDLMSKDRITALIKATNLPIVAPNFGEKRWLELMQIDKKNQDGEIKFIVLKSLGESFITHVSQTMLLKTLMTCTKN